MQEIAKALTWTFIHSLWQGLVAALIAAIIISCTRNASARLRYNLLGIVMILFFAGSVITFVTLAPIEEVPVSTSSVTIINEVQILPGTNGLMDNFINWVNANSDTVIVLWTFFFLFSCLRLVTGVAAVNRLRQHKTQPVTAEWKNKLEQLKLVIGVRCSVSLLQSQLVKVPVALGILKPVILLPLGLITHLPPEQVETILLHELAHIRRRDYLVNLCQHIVEAIFFFNPAVRWISSLLRQEREASCDDIVVANCNQKANYLNALVNFQEYSFRHNTPYAMSIGSKRHYLLNRVKRIISNKNKGLNLFEKAGLLAGVFLFSAFSFVTKNPDYKPEPGSYVVRQPAEKILPTIISQPQDQVIKTQMAKLLNEKVKDTVPAKKIAGRSNKPAAENKPIKKLNDGEQATKDANAKLQEIIQLKDKIGLKKETIGVMKEQLKTKEGQDKEKILKKLKKERNELDAHRKVLDIKREQWDYLKEKVKEKQVEEKQVDAKKIISPGKSKAIVKGAIQWDKSDQPDKSDQWDASDQWDKNDENKGEIRPNRVSPRVVKYKPEIHNNKLNKQEFQNQLHLQLKDKPPAKQVSPENTIKPGTPAKKAQPVRT